MDYKLWTPGDDLYVLDEDMLEKVDRAVWLGEQYGLHVSLNMHAAPGYCINPQPGERFNLWKDREAVDAFGFQWETFAERYRGIPSSRLSFNLLNEPRVPAEIGTKDIYTAIVREVTGRIHASDPERLVIADGTRVGTEPLPELADLDLAQGCRAYAPAGVSHYKATWVPDSENWPTPTWPQRADHPGGEWNRKRLEEFYQPWIDLAASGVGVHCGEGGSHQYTPHDVALAWFADVLDILKAHNIGWALWNIRGQFGIIDSNREDVDYEDWYGHKLDRKYLDLLQRS